MMFLEVKRLVLGKVYSILESDVLVGLWQISSQFDTVTDILLLYMELVIYILPNIITFILLITNSSLIIIHEQSHHSCCSPSGSFESNPWEFVSLHY